MQDIASREDLKLISGKNSEELERLGKSVVEMEEEHLQNEGVHGEIKKHLQMFDELLSSSRSRELSLQSLIEAKDKESKDIEDQTRALRSQTEKIDLEHNQLAGQARLRQAAGRFKAAEGQHLVPRDCQELLSLLQQANGVGEFWRNTDSSTFEQSISETRDLLQSLEGLNAALSLARAQKSDLTSKLQLIQESITQLAPSEALLQASIGQLDPFRGRHRRCKSTTPQMGCTSCSKSA